MNCKLILAKTNDEEEADKLAEFLLNKKLALYIDVIETKTYIKQSIGSIEKQTEYLLIIKTSPELVKEAKKKILHRIPFEKGDLIILDTSGESTRIDLLLSKLKSN